MISRAPSDGLHAIVGAIGDEGQFIPAPPGSTLEEGATTCHCRPGWGTANGLHGETSFASVGFAATYTRAGTAIINARVFDRVGLTATYYLGIPFWLSVLFCRARLPAHTLT